MAKKTKIAKSRKDKFYKMAKTSGYRSRAAFKLVQINRKFDFLNASCHILIDLCASPGGWLQVARSTLPVNSLIIGVDLVKIDSVPGCKTMQADITSQHCRDLLRTELHTAKAKVILNDGAPNVGGAAAWNLDSYRQAELCLAAMRLATEFLAPGGTFVTKVFRSDNYEALRLTFAALFRSVKTAKPEASRLESAEIFLVCQGYKAPDQIDERFLDPNFVFKQINTNKSSSASNNADKEENSKCVESITNLINSFKASKKKAPAEGYDAADVYSEMGILELLRSPRPLHTLTQRRVSKVLLDTANADEQEVIRAIRQHSSTTQLILADLDDIRQMRDSNVRTLFKWMQQMQRLFAHKLSGEKRKTDNKEEMNGEREDDEEEENDGDEDDEMDVEDLDEADAKLLEATQAESRAEAKRKLRKQRKEICKKGRAIQMEMAFPGDRLDQGQEAQQMFSALRSGLVTRHRIAAGDGENDKEAEEGEKEGEGGADSDSEAADGDIENRDVDVEEINRDAELLEKELVAAERRRVGGAAGKQGRQREPFQSAHTQRYSKQGDHAEDEEEENGDSSSNEEDEAANEADEESALQKKFREERERKAAKQKLKKEKEDSDKDEQEDDKEEEEEEEKQQELENEKKRHQIERLYESEEFRNLMDGGEMRDEDAAEEDQEEGEEEKQTAASKSKKKNKAAKKEAKKSVAKNEKEKADVTSPSVKEDEDVDLMTNLNPRKRIRALDARELAMASCLAGSTKKARRETLEWGYNRYQFPDSGDPGLPKWFVEDEEKHMRPREMPDRFVEAERKEREAKEKSGAVSGQRTIKKVQEARAKKMHQLQKRLKRFRKKTDAIMGGGAHGDDAGGGEEEMSGAEKLAKMKELLRRSRLNRGNTKTIDKYGQKKKLPRLVVSSKSGNKRAARSGGVGGPVRVVDRRSKADSTGRHRGKRKSEVITKKSQRGGGGRAGRSKSRAGGGGGKGGKRASAGGARRSSSGRR